MLQSYSVVSLSLKSDLHIIFISKNILCMSYLPDVKCYVYNFLKLFNVMLNLLFVSTEPCPADWSKKLNASITHIAEGHDADSWGRIIREHYGDADALLTDLCPIWPKLDATNACPIGLNGLEAMEGAKRNELPAFAYTPFVAPVVLNKCYRAGCNAVVSSYRHSLDKLSGIISDSCKNDTVWIDKIDDDDLYNQLQCVTDVKLRDLTDTEIRTFLHIVKMDSYEQSAEALNLTVQSMRNYASKIFKGKVNGVERFPNRGAAIGYALKIGIKGIVD